MVTKAAMFPMEHLLRIPRRREPLCLAANCVIEVAS